MNRKEFVETAKTAFHEWQHNNATLRSAALAFFIVLPLPSLLLITVEVYSQFYGQTQGVQQLIQQVSSLAGPTVASLVQQLLKGSTSPFTSVFNSVLSVAFALLGAVGAFAVLQDTLNAVWEVELPPKRSISVKLRERIVPFTLIFASAIVVIGWLQFTNLFFSSISDSLGRAIGTLAASAFLFLIQVAFSFGSALLLFAIILKELPDTEIEWGDAWIGAAITAIVFTILNNLFGFYLHTFPVTSVAGVAGSLIFLLLWVFVVAQGLMFGAQFSKAYAEKVGSHSDKESGHPHLLKPEVIERVLNDIKTDTQRLPEKAKEIAEKVRISAPEDKAAKTEPEMAEKEAAVEKLGEKKREEEQKKEESGKASETIPQVTLSEEEAEEPSEKDYKLQVKWKTKNNKEEQKEDS